MKALNEQSVLDIAVQIAGTPEAAYELAKQNRLSITDNLEPGQEIEAVTSELVQDKNIATYYAQKGLKPATRPILYRRNEKRFWFPEMPLEFE